MLIYLASPYSHEDPAIRHQRYEAVLNMTAKMILKWGLIVYSPIAHNHHIALMHEERNESYAFGFWEKFDKKMIARCDELWIYTIDGWKESKGVLAEREFALSLGMKIRFVDDNTERIISM